MSRLTDYVFEYSGRIGCKRSNVDAAREIAAKNLPDGAELEFYDAADGVTHFDYKGELNITHRTKEEAQEWADQVLPSDATLTLIESSPHDASGGDDSERE